MTSVAETIATNVVATIAAIPAFAAPTAGGCTRSWSAGQDLKKLPQAIVFCRDETKERGPFPAFSCRITFEVHLIDGPESASDATWETHIDGLIRSVEKALMADPGRGLGANSGVDTFPTRSSRYLVLDEPGENLENIAGVLFVDVTYRHDWKDPEVSV